MRTPENDGYVEPMKIPDGLEIMYEQMLAAIVQSSDDAIASKTLDGIVTSWNKGAEKLFGYSAEEMIGQPITRIIPENRLEEEPIILEKIKRGERMEAFDTIRVTKSGELLNISLTLSPIKDQQGRIIGVSKIARNITLQKKLHAELQQSESRLRMAVEATSLGTWDYQPHSNTLRWSNECRKIYDMPEDVDVDFKLFEEHIYPDDKDFALNAIAKAMDPDGDGSYDIQFRILLYSTKQPRWIRSQGKVYFNSNREVQIFIGTVLDITAEKVKEQALIDSISLFQRMADTVPVMIWTSRADGYCYYLNERWYDYTGQSTSNSLGYGWLDAVHPADRANTQQLFAQANEQQRPFNLVYRLCGKDGIYRWMMATAKPKFDINGRFEGMTGALIEIDERKKAEEALKDSENRLNIVLEDAGMGAWELNFKHQETKYSKRYLQIMGFDVNERPVHSELMDRIYPEDLPKRINAVNSAMMTGILDFEIRIVRKDGALRWVKAKGKVFYDEKGVPEKMLGTITDITDQKAAFEALQESESRLTKLADAMPQLVWIAEPDGEITYYNNRIDEYGPAGKSLQKWDWHLLIHPQDLDITIECWQKAVETQQPYSQEHRMMMKDGNYRWHLSRGFPDKDSNGNIIKWFGTATDIDKIKNIQESMKVSEERLWFALDAAEMGIWSIDLTTGSAVTSERHQEMMGYEDMENLTRDKYLKYLHPEDRPVLDALYEKGIKEGHYQHEVRVLRPGKPMSWVKVQGKTIYDDKGNPTTILGTVVDITREKNSANAIQESEELFRTIANTAPVMIWMSGNDKFSDFFNTSWLNFTGRTLQLESGEGWQESVHPEDLARCIKVYNESYELQQPFVIEYRLRRFDGVYRWIVDNAVPRYDQEGKFIGFISACMDIDDEKKFNEKLQASELLFKTITNISPVGLWMTDAQGNNNFVNDTWINWTGITLENQYNIGWLDPVLPEDREIMYSQFITNMPTMQKFTFEFRFKSSSGQLRWGLSEGFPYFDDNGNFGGYAGSVTDITERKQNEILKNDFLAVASHELKTPLTSIKAYSQLLSKTYERANDAFLKNGLTKVETQVNKMTKLVADFLNLSKLESDKFSMDLEKFDINELVRDIASDIQMVAINHTIVLERRRPIFVIADKEKISQVVTNLLTNAVKYSPEDKNIQVTLKMEDGWVRVSVVDKGIGIKPGEHEKIFQRFYRSAFNDNISFSGFGIGLYISAEIIKKHNGKIGVVSDEGRGADFYFMLPVV
ncbi:MAG TPA: PAS domain-containing protein [Chitinophagaceae bacterium]